MLTLILSVISFSVKEILSETAYGSLPGRVPFAPPFIFQSPPRGFPFDWSAAFYSEYVKGLGRHIYLESPKYFCSINIAIVCNL